MAKKAKQQEKVDSIFDHFARMGRPVDASGGDEKSPDVATLMAQQKALETQIAELKAAKPVEYPMRAPTQERTQDQYQVDPSKLRVSREGLPDPHEDPEGHQRGYDERVNAALQAQGLAVQNSLTAKFERERASERLWAGFKTAHPEWAPFEPLVETVANRVTNDLTAKGVDLQRYMLGSPEKFYGDIVSALKQQYGKLVEANDEEDDSEEGVEEGETPDSSRVTSLGSDGTPAGKKRGMGGEKQPDMFDDLRAIQKRMGVI